MPIPSIILGLGGIIATGLGLWGLHRLGLWLEDRGLIYYARRKPTTGAAGSFVAIQRIIEPGTEHVLVVHEHVMDDDTEPGTHPTRRRIKPK